MKKAFFLLFSATMMLAACNGGGASDRTDIPTTDQGVVEKVATSPILINTDGTVLSQEKANELVYGKILNPAISYRVRAYLPGITDKDPSADKTGAAYVTANITWTFDAHWVIQEGPDAAHTKAKGTYPKAGEQTIESKASAVITFGSASKTVNYTLLMLPKAS